MNETAERELTLRDYARVVARRKWVVVVAVLATVGTAIALAALQTPVYQAEAQMLVKTRASDTIFDNGATSYGDPKRAVQTEIKVLESEPVAQRVQQDLGLTALPPDAVGTVQGDTDVVAVTVRSGDPTTARVVADAYVQAYIDIKREQSVEGLLSAGAELQKKVTELQEQIDAIDAQVANALASERDQVEAELASQRRVLVDQQGLFKQRLDQLQVDAALATGGAQVVRQAEQPTDPVEPTPLRTGALALVVGLLLGLGAAFLLDYLDDSVRSTEDMESAAGGLPVLAVVPIDPPPDHLPISVSRPTDFAVEAYRGLRTSLQFISLDTDTRIIQVTSPLSGDGKTTTAANLAVVFAQAGLSVILIDADLRKPRLHEVFAVPGDRGLTDALLGEGYQQLVHRVFDNLDLMTAGTIPPNPSEMLGSRQMRSLLESLSEAYEIVVVDSAPVLPVTDSVALSAAVQGVLLVCSSGRTSTKQVRSSLAQLQRVQAPVLGTVLNKAGSGKSGYGGYGGYGPYGGYRQPADLQAGKSEGKSVAEPTIEVPIESRQPVQN